MTRRVEFRLSVCPSLNLSVQATTWVERYLSVRWYTYSLEPYGVGIADMRNRTIVKPTKYR